MPGLTHLPVPSCDAFADQLLGPWVCTTRERAFALVRSYMTRFLLVLPADYLH